jgi:hypothetical protein
MNEVELTCVGDTAHIPDLGLKMVRGSQSFITLTALANSRDLVEARKFGLVTVRVIKAQVIKRGSPTVSVKHPNNRQTIFLPAYQPSTPVNPPPNIPDPRDIPNNQIAELIREIRGLRGDIQKRPQEVLSGQMVGAISAAIRDALQGLQLGAISGSQVRGPIDPEDMFIPSGIVTGVKAEITTLNETSESTSGLDDAHSALKKARRDRQEP